MSPLIFLSFFLFFGSSSSSDYGDMTDSSDCFATDRRDKGQPCVFPFSDESGSLHNTCTANGDAYGEEWCATQTDLEHSVLEWGHCSPGCQDNAKDASMMVVGPTDQPNNQTDNAEYVSMMVVGPTGAGKSSLLNALLCPAKWTNDYDDCHFRTDDSVDSVTKNITQRVGPWLGLRSPVKVFDTPGLGDSDGLSDTDTLKGMIEIINSEPVHAILMIFKAVDRFSKEIQKQLRTLEYILGPQLWDHVITVFTFWGFSTKDIQKRVKTCVKERKSEFGNNLQKTKAFCKQLNFENEKVEEMTKGFENYLNVTKKFPFAFPHPLFDYDDENLSLISFYVIGKI